MSTINRSVMMAHLFLVAVLIYLPLNKTEAGEVRHGLSTFGTLKYKADFPHFDYVNPNAPKGGTISMIGTGGRITFDSFNDFIRKGVPAQGLNFLYDSLMVRAGDEPDSVYGLVAKSVERHNDGLGVTFTLRKEARFADGRQIRAEDAVFTLNTLKQKGAPQYQIVLRDVISAEAIESHRVRYRFKGNLTRDLPLIIAELPLLPKHFYDKHPFEKSGLTSPLGSGPYEIKDFKQGRFVTYKRRDDYWGRDLNVNLGRYNFDQLRFEYFKDRVAEFEGLKAAAYDLREEFTSRDWATKYNIPAVKSGRLQKVILPDERPSGAQGFFINTRREKLKDYRVREALGLAFDFEWTNKNLFYNLYERTASYFENSELKAKGKPDKGELALLTPFKDQLPEAVFEPVWEPAKTDGSGQDRRQLRRASKLLKQAGWQIKDGKRINAKGEQLTIEFLTFSPTFIRIINPYIRNIEKLGIKASIRHVDPAQFQERMKSFDFDLVTQRFVLRLTPGIELKNYFSAAAVNAEGSLNLAGISNKVVDHLVDKVIAAKSRAELVTASRALDRVLRAGHYWVPHWYKAEHHMAYWNKFSWPKKKPKFQRGIIDLWWYDQAKAEKLEK